MSTRKKRRFSDKIADILPETFDFRVSAFASGILIWLLQHFKVFSHCRRIRQRIIRSNSCDGGYNLSKFCDPALDAALNKVGSTIDPAERNAVYADIAHRLQEEAITTFLVHTTQSEATLDTVRNYRIHPFGHYVLTADVALSE